MAAIFSSLSTVGCNVCVNHLDSVYHTYSYSVTDSLGYFFFFFFGYIFKFTTRCGIKHPHSEISGLNIRLSDAKSCEQIAVKLSVF